jgi:TonB-dependent SusC/RagA subfamily outer membrane receptor
MDGGYEQMDARDSNQANHMVYPNRDKPSNLSLNDMLRRLPGVRILGGRGPNATIVVRGTSTFITSTDPLFVLNGVVIGSDFRTVHASVNPREIISLNVLAGPDATIYGTRGSNGVILIRTR